MPAVRDRSTSWQPVAVSVAIAVATGAVVLLYRRDALALAPPPACAGALELVAALVIRATPTTSAGQWLPWANALTLIVALTAFASVVARTSRRWVSAIAATGGFAMLPMFAPTLAPLATGAIAITGLAWLTLLRQRAEPTDSQRRLSIGWWAACLLTVLVEPRLTWPLAIVVAWQAAAARDWRTSGAPIGRPWSREPWLVAAASAGLLALASWLFQLVLVPRLPPSLPGTGVACLLPGPAGVGDALDSARWVLTSAGGFAVSLAALGLFSRRAAWRDPQVWPLVAYAIAPLAVVRWPDPEPLKMLGPSVVACWVLVSLGLDELIDACGPRVAGRVVAGALVLALPGLQFTQPTPRPRAALLLQGQETLSRTDVQRWVDGIQDQRILISEDALTDVLLRSLDGLWQHGGKTLYIAPRDAPALAERLRTTNTAALALPGAQADLQYLGFRLSESASVGLSGVAEVRFDGACRPLSPAWRASPELAKSSAFAVVSQDDHSRDAIVVYVTSDRPLTPTSLDWPGATTRGFLWDSYDLGDDSNKGRLASAASADQLRAERVDAHRYVLRFVLQWMPDAPRVLAVGIGNPPDEAIARIDSNNASRRVALCPAFPYERSRLSAPR